MIKQKVCHIASSPDVILKPLILCNVHERETRDESYVIKIRPHLPRGCGAFLHAVVGRDLLQGPPGGGGARGIGEACLMAEGGLSTSLQSNPLPLLLLLLSFLSLSLSLRLSPRGAVPAALSRSLSLLFLLAAAGCCWCRKREKVEGRGEGEGRNAKLAANLKLMWTPENNFGRLGAEEAEEVQSCLLSLPATREG